MMTGQNKDEKKFFYGWWILGACIVIQAVPYCIATNAQPQFMNYVVKGEGFTLTQFSLIFTIGTVVSAIVSPFIGKLLSSPKAKFKLIYLVGAILSGAGFAAFAFAKGIWSFYLIAAVVFVGNAIFSCIGIPLLINSWFTERKGLAMGLAYAGAGLGNVFLQGITAYLLSTKGYRFTYFVFGIVALVVSIPITLCFMRLPKDKSELVQSTKKRNKGQEEKKNSHWGYTFREVQKMKTFWVLAIGFIFVGLYVSAMAVQYMNYFYDIGKTAAYVGLTGSIFAAFSIVGNLIGGVFFDKFGVKMALVVACILVVISGGCLIFLPSANLLGYIFVITNGFAIYSYIVGPSYLSATLFGNREYGTILGVVQIFFAIGFAFGSSAFGLIVDITGGSYVLGWVIATLCAILAYVLLIYASVAILNKNKSDNVYETKRISD